MKIKDGYVIRPAADSYVVMKLGGNADFGKMITLNETGKLIWEFIAEGLTEQEIARRITEEYDIGFDTALRDVMSFTEKMREADVLE